MTDSVRRRPSRRTFAVAVIIAVLGVAVAWDNSRDERPHASVGDLIDAADPLTGAEASYVLLPIARLDIRATGALDDVDRDAEVRAEQAPEDGSFVGLQIVANPVTGGNAVLDPIQYPNFYGVETRLTLVADGRRYPVGSGGKSTSPPFPVDSYVAVAGEPSKLELEVSFDGKTQTVDLRTGKRTAGPFAELYRNRVRTKTCGAPAWSSGITPVGTATCSLEGLVRTPYYPKLGWAPDGRAWLVVRVTVVGADGYTYRRTGAAALGYEHSGYSSTSYRLDGVGPANAPNPFGGSDYDTLDTAVFSVPATETSPGTLVVAFRQQAKLRNDNPGSASLPFLRAVTATWTVRL